MEKGKNSLLVLMWPTSQLPLSLTLDTDTYQVSENTQGMMGRHYCLESSVVIFICSLWGLGSKFLEEGPGLLIPETSALPPITWQVRDRCHICPVERHLCIPLLTCISSRTPQEAARGIFYLPLLCGDFIPETKLIWGFCLLPGLL